MVIRIFLIVLVYSNWFRFSVIIKNCHGFFRIAAGLSSHEKFRSYRFIGIVADRCLVCIQHSDGRSICQCKFFIRTQGIIYHGRNSVNQLVKFCLNRHDDRWLYIFVIFFYFSIIFFGRIEIGFAVQVTICIQIIGFIGFLWNIQIGCLGFSSCHQKSTKGTGIGVIFAGIRQFSTEEEIAAHLPDRFQQFGTLTFVCRCEAVLNIGLQQELTLCVNAYGSIDFLIAFHVDIGT